VNTPAHHPDPDLLDDFATGQVDRAIRVVLETHLAHCGRCAARLAASEHAAARALAAAPTSRPLSTTWARLATRLDEVDPTTSYPLPAAARAELGSAAGHRAGILRWRRLPFSRAKVAVLDEGTGGSMLLLGRSGAGRVFPRHRHIGEELVTVLEGGYEDDRGHFVVGDFVAYPAGSTHTALSDTDSDCVVLACLTAGARFAGLTGAVLALRRLARRGR
jgi:putative transcriptional regulator